MNGFAPAANDQLSIFESYVIKNNNQTIKRKAKRERISQVMVIPTKNVLGYAICIPSLLNINKDYRS